MSKKKAVEKKAVEQAVTEHEVELLDVTHKFTDLDYFTPNMRLQLGEVLARLSEEEISQAQAVQEAGLVLTHHPKARRSVSYTRYNKLLLSNPDLFDEVIKAGTAVFQAMSASVKEGIEAAAGDTPKEDGNEAAN